MFKKKKKKKKKNESTQGYVLLIYIVQFNVDIVVKIVHIIVIMLRASGKIGIANCV